MGANTTQAQGVVLFLIAFTLIALGFAADVSWIALLLGIVLVPVSIIVFRKCKPWEHNQE